MTPRKPCPSVPKPLEEYAQHFDDIFGHIAQRHSFREYLLGLLLPRDRNKTLTALVGTEPEVDAQAAAVQRLQSFVSESPWWATALNARRLEVLQADPRTTMHERGVLIVDDTGDRKSGTHTAHVGRQYLGSVGKIDNGIVVVSTLWADEERYYPLHAEPYTPAHRLSQGQADPAFRTKPQIALQLLSAALDAGILFRALVADTGYGENRPFVKRLREEGLPYVVSVKATDGIWAPADAVHSPQEAVEELPWGGPRAPGQWQAIRRPFRDGHTETWWAAELVYGPYGPEQSRRRVAVTTDPAQLPAKSTWYVETNLPAPHSSQARISPLEPADLAEIVRLYGLRGWVEQSYKQCKTELGWADAMVRADVALRRHWLLIFCAFTFCWLQWLQSTQDKPMLKASSASGEKKGSWSMGHLAASGTPGAQLAHAVGAAAAVVARLEPGPSTRRTATAVPLDH
jgi:DDE superfamily endonuclease